MRRAAALAVLLALAACGRGQPAQPPGASPSPSAVVPTVPPGPDLASIALDLEEVAAGLESPVFVTHAGDGSGRLYVIEQYRGIRVLDPTEGLLPEPFLDLTGHLSTANEQGFLGLAFHPNDPSRFYINHTDPEGDTVIAGYRADSPTRADAGSQKVLLRVDQPYANHNGGMLAFGPDGFLYASLGDGGGGGDPHGNGQSLRTLLGKILRLDVDHEPYRIPTDNPFPEGARPEIWAYGLRNPWRFSFDRATGDVWIGDVGQSEIEEIDVLPAGTPAGANLGWSILEGSGCYASGECDPSVTVLPVAEYPTAKGCAVTGGYVYRGTEHPALAGVYLYADHCGGQIWGLDAARAAAGERVKPRLLVDSGLNVTSFGEDEAGELYLADRSGAVYRITAS